MSAIGPAAAAGTTPLTGTQSTAQTGMSGLTQNDFLQLLVAQMQNQDPTNPMSSDQFLQEMASFTEVVDLAQIQQTENSVLANEVANQGLMLLGRTVSAVDPANGQTVSGTVSALTMVGGQPMLSVGQSQVPVSAVVSVQG